MVFIQEDGKKQDITRCGIRKTKKKGIWRIGARQNCIHALFYYERLDPKMEEYYEHLRQKAQIERAIAKQNMERYDNYLK